MGYEATSSLVWGLEGGRCAGRVGDGHAARWDGVAVVSRIGAMQLYDCRAMAKPFACGRQEGAELLAGRFGGQPAVCAVLGDALPSMSGPTLSVSGAGPGVSLSGPTLSVSGAGPGVSLFDTSRWDGGEKGAAQPHSTPPPLPTSPPSLPPSSLLSPLHSHGPRGRAPWLTGPGPLAPSLTPPHAALLRLGRWLACMAVEDVVASHPLGALALSPSQPLSAHHSILRVGQMYKGTRSTKSG